MMATVREEHKSDSNSSFYRHLHNPLQKPPSLCSSPISDDKGEVSPTPSSFDPLHYTLPGILLTSYEISYLKKALFTMEQERNAWKTKAMLCENELKQLKNEYVNITTSMSVVDEPEPESEPVLNMKAFQGEYHMLSSKNRYTTLRSSVRYSNTGKGGFCCFVCAETFESQDELHQHCGINGHYCCRTCTRKSGNYLKFETKKKLVYHLKNYHNPYE